MQPLGRPVVPDVYSAWARAWEKGRGSGESGFVLGRMVRRRSAEQTTRQPVSFFMRR